MRTAFFLALTVTTAAVPAFGQLAQSTTQYPIKAVGDAARGAGLAKRWCAECHSPNGVVSDAAPTFQWIARRNQQQPGFIRAFLTHPHAPMPPLELDRSQIEDLVTYFGTLAAH
jgi:mono/diheme cytochrome c family protein